MTRAEWEIKNNYWSSKSCRTCNNIIWWDQDYSICKCRLLQSINLYDEETINDEVDEDFICDRWDG